MATINRSSPSAEPRHTVLAELCSYITPKLNPYVTRGLACHYLKETDRYMKSFLRRTFHEAIPGLEFVDYEVCTTEEEFAEITKDRNNKRVYDCAPSDLYLVKVKLAFEGVALPDRFTYLPFVRDGGLLRLSGSLFHLTPVLTNKVISPGHKSLFVRMLGTRKNFYRTGYSIKTNGITRMSYVTHAPIYEAKDKKKSAIQPTTKANSTMLHYLLLKYGFTETFQRYLGHVPVVGTIETITEDNYPEDHWVIVSTAHTRIKPAGYVEALYKPSDIRLAVRKDKWDQATISFVSEFFYVVDHFPQSVTPESVDNTNSWLILMGHVLVGGQYTVGRIYSQMQEHLTSLDDFVDEEAVDRLGEKGYVVNNFYDLAALLSMKFPELLAENDRAGNIYEKYYDVLYHTLRPVTYTLTRVKYALMQVAKRRPPTYSSVSNILMRKFNSGPIFKLSSDGIITETVSYSGDHLYFQLTSKVSEQEKAAVAGKSGGRKGFTDASFLDVSMIEGGSILFLPNSDPTPVGNINPYVNLDLRTGSIIPNPELKEVLDKTRVLLDKK